MHIGEAAKERITETFCPDCKHKLNTECSRFYLEDAVCKNFTWKSKARQAEFEKQVRHNQAVTEWLDKGKTLEEIYTLSERKLLSILEKKKPLPEPVAYQVITPKVKEAPAPEFHVFTAVKDGKQKKFKRSLAIKNYESEIKSLRKYLLSQGLDRKSVV